MPVVVEIGFPVKVLPRESRVVPEHTQSARILVRQQHPERIRIIPPPHDLVIRRPGNDARRVDMVRIHVVHRRVSTRNRLQYCHWQIIQVHGLLDHLTACIVLA